MLLVTNAKMIKRGILELIIIIAISFCVYSNALENGFVYDDSFTIVENHFIKDLENIPDLFNSNYFKWSAELSYRPLVTFSYFIDYSIWRLNPLGYHLSNIFIHIINCLLIYLFIQIVSRNRIVSFLTSIIFAVHPVLTETVNGISYREDLIASMFFLASFILYFKSNQFERLKPIKRFENKRNINQLLIYLSSLLCYFLGLMSKEIAITLPILIIIADILSRLDGLSRLNSLSRIVNKILRNYLGFILIGGGYIFLRFVIFKNVNENLDSAQNSMTANLLIMPSVIASYIKLLITPVFLSADHYVFGSSSVHIIPLVLSIVLLILIILFLVKIQKYSRLMLFSVIWFFVSLLPVCNFIPIVNVMAERYLYIPAIGFCLTLALILNGVITIQSNYFKPDFLRMSAAICIIIIISIYSLLTISRNMDWKDNYTLWSSALIHSSDSPRVRNMLGNVYKEKGLILKAEQEFNKAVKLNPYFSPPYVNLSSLYKGAGNFKEAYRIINLAIEINPNSGEAYANLGNICERIGLLEEALNAYNRSIEIIPENVIVLNNLSTVYTKMGLFDESRRVLNRALEINQDFAEAHHNLGNVYKNRGLINEAINEYKLASGLKPDLIESHNSLVALYLKEGKIEDAINEYNALVKIKPDDSDIYNNLAVAYVKQGMLDNAIASFRNALKLSNNKSDIYVNLGNVYYKKGMIPEAERELALAIEYDNGNALAHKNIGLIYMNKKTSAEKALFHLKESLRFSPNQPGFEELSGHIHSLEMQLNE